MSPKRRHAEEPRLLGTAVVGEIFYGTRLKLAAGDGSFLRAGPMNDIVYYALAGDYLLETVLGHVCLGWSF
jgi:hypothetical protein